MSGLRRVLHPILIAAVVFAVLPFALPRFGSAGTLATEIAIYTLYAMGFNLLLGYTGLVSFGASAFFGTASYAIWRRPRGLYRTCSCKRRTS